MGLLTYNRTKKITYAHRFLQSAPCPQFWQPLLLRVVERQAEVDGREMRLVARQPKV